MEIIRTSEWARERETEGGGERGRGRGRRWGDVRWERKRVTEDLVGKSEGLREGASLRAIERERERENKRDIQWKKERDREWKRERARERERERETETERDSARECKREGDLLLYVSGGQLGGLQVLHQLRVPQEVSGGRGQAGQQVVLQGLQGDLEAVLLRGQVGLGGGRREKHVLTCYHRNQGDVTA